MGDGPPGRRDRFRELQLISWFRFPIPNRDRVGLVQVKQEHLGPGSGAHVEHGLPAHGDGIASDSA